MSSLIWHVTMSVDGFIAGRDDSMDWVVARGSDGGENTRDVDVQRSAVADDVLHSAGAILGGRHWYDVAVHKFDGYDGIYGGQWTGPVFVLTHRPARQESSSEDRLPFRRPGRCRRDGHRRSSWPGCRRLRCEPRRAMPACRPTR